MKKLSKKLLVVILILATLITTPSISAYAQFAQLDEKMQYKQYNKYWKCPVYKEYDLVNSWLKTEEAQETTKGKWGIIGTKQDEHIKDKAMFTSINCWGKTAFNYYAVDYYTTRSDFSKEDQKYLPKVSVTQKGSIITIKFKNLKTYAKKIYKEGFSDWGDDDFLFWDCIKLQPTKGVNDGLYEEVHATKELGCYDCSAYGKVIKVKEWEYVQIDTRYGMYKGKVDLNVVMPYTVVKDYIFCYANEEFGFSDLSVDTRVYKRWSYVALSTTVNCKFDKSKTISPAKKPVIPNTGKFKKA